MKNIEIRLKPTDKNITVKQAIQLIETKIQNPLSYNTIEVGTASLPKLRKHLAETYNCSIQNSWLDGAYGMRTGGQTQGLQVWLSPEHLPERIVDEGCEYANFYHLLNSHGELVEELDGDSFKDACEELGLKVKSDNTYNYSGDSRRVGYIFDVQFDLIQSADENGPVYLACMFHCGGDPRGNYTSKQVWKFSSIDEVYSVLFPDRELTNEESEGA